MKVRGRSDHSTSKLQFSLPVIIIVLLLARPFLVADLSIDLDYYTLIFSSEASVSLTASSLPYDPKNCTNMDSGHCNDEKGGAWSYKKPDGKCLTWAPADRRVRDNLPKAFPDTNSVMDFGGGIGAYLTGFHERGVKDMVVVEPHDLGECMWNGIHQETTDWANTPLQKLPVNRYDLVMTIEVLEHIPVTYHQHLLQAFEQASRQWLVFSAARPGQAGEGHVGPSMKERSQWIDEVHKWTSFQFDANKTSFLHKEATHMIKTNLAVFRKEPSSSRKE